MGKTKNVGDLSDIEKKQHEFVIKGSKKLIGWKEPA